MWYLTNECVCKAETDSDILNKLVVFRGDMKGMDKLLVGWIHVAQFCVNLELLQK